MEITWPELLMTSTAVVSFMVSMRTAILLNRAFERIERVWEALASHDEQFAELYLKTSRKKDVPHST
ncbi:MAG TPA: hypothetical protein VGN57_18900 [Pirellulaceae bacterium]|jgi:hypothetical protein|nr:hypothetical protein [Pirellulaceae bacterium]